MKQTMTSEAGLFGLAEETERSIQEEPVQQIRTHWEDAADYAGMTAFQSELLRRSTILSEGIFYQ